MTKYRLTKDQLITEPYDLWKHIKFWLKVEPDENKGIIKVKREDGSIHWDCPYKPNDHLVLMKDWALIKYKRREEYPIIHTGKTVGKGCEYYRKQPSSTMPKSLDSQCKQYVIKRIIKVDKMLSITEQVEQWYFFGIAKEMINNS